MFVGFAWEEVLSYLHPAKEAIKPNAARKEAQEFGFQ
jgi:hypothetical protein